MNDAGSKEGRSEFARVYDIFLGKYRDDVKTHEYTAIFSEYIKAAVSCIGNFVDTTETLARKKVTRKGKSVELLKRVKVYYKSISGKEAIRSMYDVLLLFFTNFCEVLFITTNKELIEKIQKECPEYSDYAEFFVISFIDGWENKGKSTILDYFFRALDEVGGNTLINLVYDSLEALMRKSEDLLCPAGVGERGEIGGNPKEN